MCSNCKSAIPTGRHWSVHSSQFPPCPALPPPLLCTSIHTQLDDPWPRDEVQGVGVAAAAQVLVSLDHQDQQTLAPAVATGCAAVNTL